MTSLLVLETANQNTFEHFYTSLLEQFNSEDNISKKEWMIIIIKIATYCFVITCCTFTVFWGWFWIIYYHSKDPNIYAKYYLFYIYDWLQNVVCPFVSILFINHIFMNGYYNYSLKHNVAITLSIVVLINGTISTLLLWHEWNYDNYVWYWKWFCQNIMTNNEDFQWSCPFYFSIDGLYVLVLGYPLNLLLTILVNYSMFCLFKKRSNNSYNYQTIEMQLRYERIITR